ncbi:MAG: flagellar hook-basal body complex protein, partial [Planctomycetes bacterium]|nr:flagellar hook-basal body complex protein [Planctomycetota bacterium]
MGRSACGGPGCGTTSRATDATFGQPDYGAHTGNLSSSCRQRCYCGFIKERASIMGLSQALYSGISGLSNHQRRMDNIGNNLANVNTVGFKKGVHQFQTLFSQTLRGGTAPANDRGAINPIQVGLGASTSSILQQFTQGSLEVTGNQRDLAIEGNGFFVLNTGISGTWGRAYTRDGTFYLGTDGKLLAGEGLRVQGLLSDENGQIQEAAEISDLLIPIGKTGAAQETTLMAMTGNLNSNVDVSTPHNNITTRAFMPTANTQSTWITGNSGNTLNLGHVETSAGLWDTQGFTDLGAGGVYSAQLDIDGDAVADWGVIDAGPAGVQTGELIDIDMDGLITAADTLVDTDGDDIADATYTYVDTDLSNTVNAGDGIDQTGDGIIDWYVTAGRRATLGTNLANLRYLRGTSMVSPFNGISTGDQIDFQWLKGGRRMTATFTYGINDATDPNLTVPGQIEGDGTTLNDLLTFLCGDVNDDGNGASDQRLLGGAMGTIHTRTRTAGTDGYDVISEHAGAFLRQYLGGGVPHDGAVDYFNTGSKNDTTRVSIGSNLGTENAITDIEISYNNVNYTDIFSEDADYGTVTGGSTTANIVVYDSLGNPKSVTAQMSLVARDDNFSTWRWIADSVDDTDATWLFVDENGDPIYNDQAAPTTSINVGTGLIRFDSEGVFVRGVELSSTGGIEIDLENQGVNLPLSIGITEGLSSSLTQDLDFSFMTSVAAASDFNLRDQNGSPPGTLDSFTVTSDGIINGVYSNGVLEV